MKNFKTMIILLTLGVIPNSKATSSTKAWIIGASAGTISALGTGYLAYKSLKNNKGLLNKLCKKIPGLKNLYDKNKTSTQIKKQTIINVVLASTIGASVGLGFFLASFEISKKLLQPIRKRSKNNTMFDQTLPEAFYSVITEGGSLDSYQAPTTLTTETKYWGNRKIIDSAKTFKDIESGGYKQWKKIKVPYTLYLPKGKEKAPAVVLSHHSAGVGPALQKHAKWLAKQGIACITLDHFGHQAGQNGRRIQRMIEDQLQMSFEEGVIDVFKAKELLTKHSKIDGTRIAATGFSRGAENVTWAQRKHFYKNLAHDQKPFDLMYCFYPAIVSQPIEIKEQVSHNPALFMVGSSDDYTPSAPVANYVKRLQQVGIDAKCILYPNTYHCFDEYQSGSSTPSVGQLSNTIIPGEIHYAYDKNGFTLCKEGLVTDATKKAQRIPWNELGKHCATAYKRKTVYIGGNPQTHKQSLLATQDFLRKNGFLT
ncbi:dienelactone hydrolase family protein [Candidatus Babeliales bacterium]|nr:dienelactone hydrolase family protein [Candidatus Babeliales bacterium]